MAEEARLKRAAQEKGENFAADQTGKQAAYEQLKARRESMTRELEAADRLRQSNEGGALLKNDLSAQQNGGERPEAPARENAQAVPTAAEEQAAHDKMTASEPAKQADQLLGEIVRLKNLPAGSAERARLPEVEQAYSKALDTRTKSPEYTDWQDKYMRRVKDQAGRATKEEPTNAVQEQSPGKETVRNPPGDGKKVGGGNPVDQGAAGKSASTPEARTKAVREKVAALPDTPVKLTYTHAETGKPAEVELPAKQAGKRLADHLETLGKIFDCLHA